jgi:hypothetical protein
MPHSSIVINKKPPPPIETVSYNPNGIDSFLQSAQTALGTGSAFSFAVWQRRTTPGQAGDAGIFFTDNSGGRQNQISWVQQNNQTCVFEVRGPDADPNTNLKRYSYTSMFTAASDLEWEHIVCVYNANGGSADTLLTYYNGVDITNKTATSGPGDVKITKTKDGDPNATDNSRKITIGSQAAFKPWAGIVYNCGLWSANLSAAAVTSMYNGGSGGAFDLNQDNGGYTNSADLQHLWRFDDAADRGKDLGIASILKDIDVNAAGTNTFITEYPGQ